jgi:hypothetical protein
LGAAAVRDPLEVRRRLLVVPLALVILALAACEPAKPKAVAYGDSFLEEAEGYWAMAAAGKGYEPVTRARLLGAMCHWLDHMRFDAASDPKPKVAVISFTGNGDYGAECMKGRADSVDEIVMSYIADLRTAVGIFKAKGIKVVLVSTPVWPGNPASEPLHQAFKSEAAKLGIDFRDGGTNLSPNRTYKYYLPCAAGEPCEGNKLNSRIPPGNNIVRDPRGTHFCPMGRNWPDPCRQYMSGALRFATNLTSAIPTVRSRR